MTSVIPRPVHVCQYCQQICELECLVDYLTGPYNSEEIWKCSNHPIKIRYIYPPWTNDLGSIWVASFLVKHKQERYAFYIHYPEQICILFQVEIGVRLFNKTELFRFPFTNQINPDNAQHKLSILLTYL